MSACDVQYEIHGVELGESIQPDGEKCNSRPQKIRSCCTPHGSNGRCVEYGTGDDASEANANRCSSRLERAAWIVPAGLTHLQWLTSSVSIGSGVLGFQVRMDLDP